jgi:hypothetical protein
MARIAHDPDLDTLQAADDPIKRFVENRLNQLMARLDLPIELSDEIWEVYTQGMQDGNLRIGDFR